MQPGCESVSVASTLPQALGRYRYAHWDIRLELCPHRPAPERSIPNHPSKQDALLFATPSDAWYVLTLQSTNTTVQKLTSLWPAALAAVAHGQSILAGHFEGGGGSVGFFDIGCGQTTNLQSLPPGYDSFVVTGASGSGCQASFFCGENEQITDVDAFANPTYVVSPCDDGRTISKYVALCDC